MRSAGYGWRIDYRVHYQVWAGLSTVRIRSDQPEPGRVIIIGLAQLLSETDNKRKCFGRIIASRIPKPWMEKIVNHYV
nr:hypothetical protein Iba_chr05bCG2970 [Ipomoea batatas]